MHLKRIITSLILAPLLVFLLLRGSYFQFSFFVAILVLLGLIEYFNLIREKIPGVMRILGIVWGVLISAGLYVGSADVIISLLSMGFIAVCLMRLARPGDLGTAFNDIGYTFLGALYVGLLLGHLSLIRALTEGREWTILLFIAVWVSDISAFYIGSLIGRHKLYPEISPNKTIEGAIGSMAGCMIVVLIAGWQFMSHISIIHLVIIAVGISIMGQLGDLCESMFKRSAGVKDTGGIIPGHGGILDRFDGFTFAAPFLYCYLVFIMKMS